jgi:protease I
MVMSDRPLQGRRVVVLVEDLYEDLELWYPTIRLREAGAEVVIASPQQARQCESKHGYPAKADVAINQVRVEDFDGVVIPGGYCPDRLRRYEEVIKLVRQFAEAGKMIAFICHAGWVPISAGIIRGVTCTGYFSIKDDLVNAGANYEDKSVVIDRNFISSRSPDDLPDFCRAIIGVLAGEPKEASAAAGQYVTSRFSR